MKTLTWIIAIISLTISACTTQKMATSSGNDDVYNSSSQPKQVYSTTPPTAQGAQVVTSPDKTSKPKPASSTFEEDYNDYSYTNRINRFSNKDTTVGYFDNSYSGSASAGNQSSEPNVNIYLGAGTGYGSYYGPSFSYGMGWGYPYSTWGWDYGWGWGYPYYYGGYNPWYNPYYYPCCYCYGYNEYYSPYYASNYYYGSRKPLYRTDGGTGAPNSRTTPVNPGSAYDRAVNRAVIPTYNRTTAPPSARSIVPTERSTQQTTRTTQASQEKYRYTRPANDKQSGYQRTTTQRTSQVQSQNTRQQPAPRYIRPENANSAQRSGAAQSYSSPVYRQPKSSQEYLAPRTQNPGTTRTANQNSEVRTGSGTYNTGTRQTTNPGYNRTYSQPSRSGSSTPRSNSNYTTPTRSGNSGSYSQPSNSNGGGSYSAPARSGGGGGGSSSGGSSGSGSSGGGGGRRR